MKPTVIYIAGFRQHAGKTVTSLGILSLLLRKFSPSQLGYIKPVGQELVELEDGSKIDKDARIIEKFSGIPDLEMKYVSPVRLGSGFTKAFLASNDQEKRSLDLAADIQEAVASMSHKKVIVAEGTGHPGVGGIVGLSNADVCKAFGWDVVYLSGGGIGKALDMLEVDLSYFAYKGARVKGIVFNKLIPEKISTVKAFITEALINQKFRFPAGPTRVLGYLPEIENLYKPSMRVLMDRFSSPEVIGDPERESWKVPARDIRVISITLEYLHLERYVTARDLIIIGGASEDRINRLLEYHR
ncbi:MAG: AAA family ATPase, partial [Spirochaetales bacterium]|nr:AAA family ATPase [Spirochaetales bacterium]